MSILVLGGAGYIGSHAVDQFISKGYAVIVVDNLLTGHRSAVHEQATFYEGDIRDKAFLRSVFEKESIEGVLHFAANSLVGESVEQPLMYFNNNVHGTQIALEVMQEFGVKHIVFSSTAATYGEPKAMPITEETPTNPKNPYGESKLMMEKIMKWCDNAYGMKYVALRYFNVAGAKKDASIGEDDTPDGSCIRDYVYIEDLIAAHILALEYLKNGGESDVFNLGSNNGYSVKEMLDAAREVTGQEIPATIAPRRAGDPSTLIASSEKAKRVLGWQPEVTEVKDIIATAWQWHQAHPHGYQEK